MAVIRKEITAKEMRETNYIFTPAFLASVTLREWGFDTNKEIRWWDDPVTGSRIIMQVTSSREEDNGRN